MTSESLNATTPPAREKPARQRPSRTTAPRPRKKKAAATQAKLPEQTQPAPDPAPLLPFVIVNMAMTVDGKIANENRSMTSFGSERDQQHLLELRATADAVMAGARTVDTESVTMGPGAAAYRQKRLQAGLREFNLRVVVSGAGTLAVKAEIFRHKFSPVIVLTTERISRIRLKELAAVADDVKVFGCNAIDFVAALRWLRAHWGVKRLLVEGGGDLNFELFRAGLVDELHLTVCPLVFGGREAPTIADGLGIDRLPKAAQFELQSMTPSGEEMFLVYRRHKPIDTTPPPPPRSAESPTQVNPIPDETSA